MIFNGTTIRNVSAFDIQPPVDGSILYLDSRNPRSWPGSGSIWYDISGNNKHATFYQNNNANPTLENNTSVAVVDGTAINGNTLGRNSQGDFYFNGTTGSAVYQYAAGSNLGTNIIQYTINVWVYFNTISLVTAYLSTVFSLGLYTSTGVGTTVNGAIMFYNGVAANDGTLHTGFYDGAWRVTSGYSVVTGSWYNAVMTYDGATIKYYINNNLAASTASASTSMINGFGYRVGRRWDGYDTVDAYIPVAMVYNRALSPAEITQNFNYFRGRYGI